MKTPFDPRHQKRRQIVQALFAWGFKGQKAEKSKIEKITNKMKKVDGLITDCAPEWPIEQINRIDLSILRLAIFEILEKKEPQKAIIDEAIELAKEFGSESSPSFVNGVLGAVLKKWKNN